MVAPATAVGPIAVKQGFFNVPSGGVTGADGLYAFFWTNHSPPMGSARKRMGATASDAAQASRTLA
jgi:hypothetical protein